MMHKAFARFAVMVAAMAAAGLCGPLLAEEAAGQLTVYFGTYSSGKSKGVYLGRFDPACGRLDAIELAAEMTNPSFLTVHPNRKFLYAVGEIGSFKGRSAGSVSALAIDPGTGKLKPLNQQSSGGSGPCHVTVHPDGRFALVANYGAGSVACLPIAEDGRLGEASVVQHRGKGADPRRQDGPHAHSINLDAAGRFAFAPDLGLDKVFVYRLDPSAGKLLPNEPAFAEVAPASGPRHFAFHPGGRFAYVINELASTVTVFAYAAACGSLAPIETVSTLPKGFSGVNYTADIHVHPSGKFLYGSNRGHNTIAVFAIDAASGKLSPVAHESTRGKTPRNFTLDPTGGWLLAANQDSDSVAVFRIALRSGKLQPVGNTVEVGKPVCVHIVPAKNSQGSK